MPSIELPDRPDEVSYSDYLRALANIALCATGLGESDPDEAAEHYLPLLTQHVAVVFSFVGSNMTARNVPLYERITAALQAAKDQDPLVQTITQMIYEEADMTVAEAKNLAERVLRRVSTAAQSGKLSPTTTS